VVALGMAALAIRSCGEEEGQVRVYGCNLNKFLCSQQQALLAICTLTENSIPGEYKPGRTEIKNKNTVHNDVTSNNFEGENHDKINQVKLVTTGYKTRFRH
jgi:hypothetical protein